MGAVCINLNLSTSAEKHHIINRALTKETNGIGNKEKHSLDRRAGYCWGISRC
jgi:hypothetical protein